jgi:hypothetical protein
MTLLEFFRNLFSRAVKYAKKNTASAAGLLKPELPHRL